MPEFTFSFEMTGDPKSQALRAWVDNGCTDLQSERELQLQHSDGCWTSRFECSAVEPDGVLWLRVAVVGEPGAIWKLQLNPCDRPHVPLMSDADTLSMPKEVLVATCHVGVSPLHAVA